MRTLLIVIFALEGAAKDGESVAKLKGSVCAYGDINRDLYTDLIFHDGEFLKVYLQGEEGEFTEWKHKINVGESDLACALGDFNGDAVPDILVSTRRESGFLINKKVVYEATIYLFLNNEFQAVPFNVSTLDELSVMDVNGDGASDVIGFLENKTLFCRLGARSGIFLPCENYFRSFDLEPLEGFLLSFADLNGDLSAEIVFGTKKDNSLKLEGWKRVLSNELWVKDPSLVSELSIEKGKHFGAILVADFDADGVVDIGVPLCGDEDCKNVEGIKVWTRQVWQQFPISGLEGSEIVSSKKPVNIIFRVGDFSLDGYPDLIALIKEEKSQNPMILENVACNDCISNASRKFELRTSPRLIQPSDVTLGTIKMVSFFDLKEDGTLDVLLEYRDADKEMAVDFIRCEDKGDTTFLKVQVFSSACSQNCGGEKIKIGSGIGWHGACVMFNMSDSWGHEQRGTQCQVPQTTYRALHTPFALFGLGRSPNFVDYVHIGSPRLPLEGGRVHYGNQHHDLKQIVPNSRLIVVPPQGNDIHWQSRLYLTPSQLIIQSLLVLVSVCAILLFVVAVLHFRERRADKQERQAQSHRFHFDAM